MMCRALPWSEHWRKHWRDPIRAKGASIQGHCNAQGVVAPSDRSAPRVAMRLNPQARGADVGVVTNVSG